MRIQATLLCGKQVRYLVTQRDHPTRCTTMAKNEASATSIRLQQRPPYVWNLQKNHRCATWVRSRLRMAKKILNIGRAKVQTVDDFGSQRTIDGQVTEIRKTLASVVEESKHNEEFGTTHPETQSSCKSTTTRVTLTVSAAMSSRNLDSVSKEERW